MTVDGRMREARIDLGALRDNVASLARTLGTVTVDVAGDAYGHGATAVAAAALEAGARGIRVRDADERAALRDAGIDAARIDLDLGDERTTAAVYGLDGSAGAPVMRVSSRVISVKTIDAGEPVSYGYTWRATTRSNLALVPLGYADGVMRAASNRGLAWLAGSMRPIVGRVAMNVLVLDLGGDEAGIGDEAVLFGDPQVGGSVSDWVRMLSAAREARIHALEVTAGIGPTVPRRLIG